MASTIKPTDIYYKIKTGVRNSYATFPMPEAATGMNIKISISFKECKTRILLNINSDATTLDEYDYPGLSEDALAISKLGHPDDSDCNIYIDQTLEQIAAEGLDKTKISILKITTVEARLSALLNGMDAAFYYALGTKHVQRRLMQNVA